MNLLDFLDTLKTYKISNNQNSIIMADKIFKLKPVNVAHIATLKARYEIKEGNRVKAQINAHSSGIWSITYNGLTYNHNLFSLEDCIEHADKWLTGLYNMFEQKKILILSIP